ncbi:MAG TPA: serine hydrolase domain-containing protein [Rhizomicrobium sp.]|nr:serine hydrolase domain-containing protein [Rhizomicrobium sp.]
MPRNHVARREFIGTALSSVALTFAFSNGAGATDADFTRAASKLVTQGELEDSFSGVILVAHGDTILLRKAAGFADRASNVPNTVQTQFPIASVTKQFTAAAVLSLVDAGKIALTDSIRKYYPEAPDTWGDITIQHLLTHSSGIGDQAFSEVNMDSTMQYLSVHRDIVPFVSGTPLLFQPGSGFQYSNTGYVILAGVIERASDEKYENYLRNRIFVPLGMTKTGFHLKVDLKGYVRSPDGNLLQAHSFDEPAGPNGPAGIYSTVDDMLTWSRAWDEGRILSAPSRIAALTDYGHNYGFGWRFAPKFGRKLVWHTGSFGPAGFASILDRFPDEKIVFVVLTNAPVATSTTATLLIEGKMTTFPANSSRKLLESVEALYFAQTKPNRA